MLNKLATITTLLVALEHVYILILEMFLWETPLGLRTFGMTPEVAAQSASLAINQGLYNGFLAAGLFWSFTIKDLSHRWKIQYFFLICVIIAGIFGGLIVGFKITVTQSLPAVIALILVYLRSSR